MHHTTLSNSEHIYRARVLRRAGWLTIIATAIVTAVIYWPGLHGPLLFDDYWNLTPIFQWQAGTVHWSLALLPNADSIVFSRPVATASFMLSVWVGGLESTFPLKFGNLLTHLACATAGAALFYSILRQDARFRPFAMPASALLVAVWLLHPLHVSTVLYIVQRAAQLSTLFCLLALCAYVYGRAHLERGNVHRAIGFLFVAFPLLMLLGVLGKQNAAITPYLCLVIEVFFLANRPVPRSQPLVAFFGIFAATPALAVLALLAIAPNRILGGYADIEFGLVERLLTQPRALFDYAGMWFVPRSAEMGLYTDDFPVSTSLLQPHTTWLSMLGLAAVTFATLSVRKLAPAVPAGWCFFLVAHIVESSFLPLEMYYEHRNYLPSFGLLLATAGLLELSLRNRTIDHRRRRLAGILALFVLLTLSASTLGRVLVWQSERSMVAQGLRHHPESIRLRIDGMALALREQDYDEAFEILVPMLSQQSPRNRWIGRLELQALNCQRGVAADPEQLKRAEADTFPVVTVSEVSVAMLFERVTRHKDCAGLTPLQIADTLSARLDAASGQPDGANNKATFQRLVSQLYARGGDWARAEFHAGKVWANTGSLSSGSMLARAHIQNGNLDAAAIVIEDLASKVRPVEAPWVREVQVLRSRLRDARDGERASPPNHATPDTPTSGLAPELGGTS